MTKTIVTSVIALLLAVSAMEIGAGYVEQGRLSFGEPAEAIVGRPLTPVSVAGVARRSVRRCAVGVYYC